MKLHHAKFTVAFLTVGGFLVAMALAVFLAWPALRDARALKRDIVRAQTELEAQYANRKHLLTSRADVDGTKALMHTLAAQFVPAGRELDFITAVEALATENGVTERLQLSAAEDQRAAPELEKRFDLLISGPYLSTMRMLADLERLPTLMIIDSLTVRPSGDMDGSSMLVIELHGSIAVPPAGLL